MAWSDLVTLAIPWWDIAIRSALIYGVLIVGFRLFGKREVGQFTLFDLVLVLLLANAVQPAMTGPDNSLLGGFIIVVVLLAVNWVVGYLRLRSPLFRHLVQAHPTVVAQDGYWLPEALRREGVDRDEAEMALREHGVADVSEVRLAVLELDGTISIVPTSSPTVRSRRRVRLLHRGG